MAEPNFPVTTGGEDLEAKDGAGRVRARIDGDGTGMRFFDENGKQLFHLELPGCNLRLGGQGQDGDIIVFRRAAKTLEGFNRSVLHFNGEQAALRLGGKGRAGSQVCVDKDGQPAVVLDGSAARIISGGNGADGELRLRMADGSVTVRAQAQGGDPGPVATLDVGGNGATGAIRILDADGDEIGHLGPSGALVLGVPGSSPIGRILLNETNAIGFTVDGSGRIEAGGFTGGGQLRLRQSAQSDSSPAEIIVLHADTGTMQIGGGSGNGRRGLIDVRDAFNNTTVLIDGEAGVVNVPNGDIAEEFSADLAGSDAIQPGMVVVFNDDAELALTDRAGDPRVAGIVAGAGDERPGVVLGRKPGRTHPVQLALTGKVWAWVDADVRPVAVGDLLITSSRPGHAEAVADRAMAVGHIVGKAMAPMTSGQALIPVMVMLR